MSALVPAIFRGRNRNPNGLGLRLPQFNMMRPRQNGLGQRAVYNYPNYDDYCECDIIPGQHICGSCAMALYQPSQGVCGCQMCDYYDEDDYPGYGLRGGYAYDPRVDSRMM